MGYERLLKRLTLEEKCALLQGGSAFGSQGVPRLGVPVLQFSDGPHGLRHQGVAGDHLSLGDSVPATCFPTAATVAQSWDPALGEQVGAALGEEAACQGVGCVLGPGLNIKRNPLGGRNFEYFSEDPLLAGSMAAAYVRGIQSRGVAACPKHFAVNSQETRRQASDSQLDERTLRELYLAGFEQVVRKADPWCLMTSYNRVNGTYANESRHLLENILRGEWGYRGAVVSDWGGSCNHAAGVLAGSTFEMPAPGAAHARALACEVRAGRVGEDAIDARVSEVLRLVERTRPAVEAARGTSFDEDAHHRLARRVAAQSVVLLKNDAAVPRGGVAEGASLLPLAAGTRVALVGSLAMEPHYQGTGSSRVHPTRLDTLAELAATDGDMTLVGVARGYEPGRAVRPALVREARDLAQAAEVAVVCLGLEEMSEAEGYDRASLCLPAAQLAVLDAVAQVNPNVVVLLMTGAPVETDWVAQASSVLHLALGGQAGAGAALDVLVGRKNPSGKTAETWYRRLDDVPSARGFPSAGPVAAYREGLYVGYRHCVTAGVRPSFPFGFGLSYTNFSYSRLRVEPGDGQNGAGTKVSFVLTNVGATAGAEVVQLYVAKPRREPFAPAQELCAFSKLYLEPAEEREVTLELGTRAFSYYNVATGAWEVEAGTFQLRVAASSEDVRLVGTVSLRGTGAPNPYADLALGPYESGKVQDVTDKEFEAMLGHRLPSEELRLDKNTAFGDLSRSRSPLLAGASLVVGELARRAMAGDRRFASTVFVYNMPLRSFGQMTGGVPGPSFVRALVREAKGWGLLSLPVGLAAGLVTKRLRTSLAAGVLWVAMPFAVALMADGVREAYARKRMERQSGS